ncbi:DUF4249 domain-containing protein [Bacteroides sp. OttesenSCG-928-D19]|nr:DUF4249 domain-containing protein [Bacteroides sp. OttesenSCG-928-D19]
MKKYSFICIWLIIIVACENEIPYKLHTVSPKLTMNAMINADSLENVLYLNFTGSASVTQVNNARVEVRINGELKETIIPVDNPSQWSDQKLVPITTRFSAGDEVRMDAYADDDKYHVWIEETIPHSIDILTVDTASVPNPYLSSAIKQLKFKVRFKDQPGKKNYYRMVLEHRHVISGKNGLDQDTAVHIKSYSLWPWDDVVLTDGQPATSEELDKELIERVANIYGVFDDGRFADNEYTMTVSSNYYISYYTNLFRPEYLNIYTAVRLLSITESQYYYLKVLNFIDSDMVDDYLNDPVKMPGNVHNGTGFVGFSTESGRVMHVVANKKMEYYEE